MAVNAAQNRTRPTKPDTTGPVSGRPHQRSSTTYAPAGASTPRADPQAASHLPRTNGRGRAGTASRRSSVPDRDSSAKDRMATIGTSTISVLATLE